MKYDQEALKSYNVQSLSHWSTHPTLDASDATSAPQGGAINDATALMERNRLAAN